MERNLMNTFYSLNLNREKEGKRSYLFEIFSYDGSYVDLTSAVRSNNIYDMADDFLFSFYDICVGGFFVTMLNNIDTLNFDDIYDLMGEDFAFTIESVKDSTIAQELQATSRKLKESQLLFALMTTCADEKIVSLINQVKELEKNKIISYESVNDSMSSFGIAYNICVTYSEDNKPIYYFENLGDVIQFDLYQLSTNSIDIKKCVNCGKYFIPKTRSDEIYCDYEDYFGKSCRQKGYENKVNNDAVLKEYRKIYKTQNARKQRNKHKPNIEELFKKWHIDAKEFLRKCQNNEISIGDMIEKISGTDWMRGE